MDFIYAFLTCTVVLPVLAGSVLELLSDPGKPRGQASGQDDREPARYDFNYNVQDEQFGVQFQHQENRQGDGTRGSYKVLLPDGRIQHVQYEADENGFRPRISYEEAPAAGGNNGFTFN